MAIDVVGIAGSLRAGSYNRALLAAAVELAPPGLVITREEIRPIPFFDGDVEKAGLPPAVAALKARVRAADALLIVTPEYNYSVPGVLKNTLDWLSRAPESALARKPAGIMGASPGAFGTVRSQHHLRQVAAGAGMRVMIRPEVQVMHADAKFDATGRLADETTRAAVAAFLVALGEWAVLNGAKA